MPLGSYCLCGVLIGLLFGVPVGAVGGLEGWITCFPKSRLAGKVFAGGVTDPGEIQNHAALAKAYEAGKNV